MFLISDFQNEGYERALRIARRRHDLIPVTVTDPREIELPKARFIEFVDSETGERITVDTTSAAFRRAFTRNARIGADRRQRSFRSMNADGIDLVAGQSFVEPLTRYFRAREARM